MKSTHSTLKLQNSIIIDTGFWVAIGSKKDRFHNFAIKVAQSLQFDPITTWPVISETSYLLQTKQGAHACDAFLLGIDQSCMEIFRMESGHLGRIRQLMKKYAELPMHLADASLVILAEELGHGRILSTDQRDFRTYRWKNHQPFENLLLPDS
ncbi:MAG TPA: VapC toxin family PIN domain ribonuclease [Gammaproteobacteria bacterium]|nr:VapC toxin family PIN domain ribonuclease [Gammaproteobacteria bacterium]